jgi:putative ABC transport system permease protein
MEPKGVDASGEDQDDQILIPITTATMRVFHVTYIKGILVQAQDEKLMSEVARSIRCLLHGRHKLGKREDDFSVNSMEEIMREKARAASIFAVLVAAVAAVSLLVGAVGVLAVMLLSVRERVQEIGVRRAVGASQADVLFQFMVESLTLTLLGGGRGLVLGVSFSALASLLLGWELVLPIRSALVGIVVSVFTGVVAGLYPAYKASLIHPIQALRL